MLHHYRCATILAMSPADEASHSLWCPGGYICIYVCKNICIYIVDAETPGYLYFYTDYVCIRVTFRLPNSPYMRRPQQRQVRGDPGPDPGMARIMDYNGDILMCDQEYYRHY